MNFPVRSTETTAAAALLLSAAVLTGCATTHSTVRVVTVAGHGRIHQVGESGRAVDVSREEYERAIRLIAPDLPAPEDPWRHARALLPFEKPFQLLLPPEEPPAQDLTRAPPGAGLAVTLAIAPAESLDALTRSYGQWCQDRGFEGDCLSLLRERAVLNLEGRAAVLLALALEEPLAGASQALRGARRGPTADATLVATMTTFLTLWSQPDATGSGLASDLMAALIRYLGFDATHRFIRSWSALARSVGAARDVSDLRREALELGDWMGESAGRSFVLLSAAALSGDGLHQRLSSLPGARHAEAAGGLARVRVASIAEISAISLFDDGSYGVVVTEGGPAAPASAEASSSSRQDLDPAAAQREFTRLRKELRMRADVGTLARFDWGDRTFYGVSLQGPRRSYFLGDDASPGAHHAAIEALRHAGLAGVRGGSGVLYTDHSPCARCLDVLRRYVRQLGLAELVIVEPTSPTRSLIP